jgi:hypothetical protein
MNDGVPNWLIWVVRLILAAGVVAVVLWLRDLP